ncbi:unnamed protein product [Caenorhabditis sp. 36 PRJEB53466]|nr:unnamed protein product [Caenorhabditis sp. 36 PRJEB53466]
MENGTSGDPILSNRIDAIVATEKHIDDMMKCAREIINDLHKEKQISKNKMDENANTFKRLITTVENELGAQMQYLSHVCVGSSHQGSTFGTLQSSLLAQSGCSSLFSDLSNIISGMNPAPIASESGPESVEMAEESPAAEEPTTASTPSENGTDAQKTPEETERMDE